MSRPTVTTKPNAWSQPLRTPPGLSKNNNNNKSISSSFSSSHKKTNITTTTTNSAKNNNNSTPSSTTSPSTLNALRYRFLQLQLSLIGQSVTLTLKNGSVLEGILHTFTPFEFPKNSKKQLSSFQNHYVLKAVKITKEGTSDVGNNGGSDEQMGSLSNLKDIKNGSTVIIPSEKVVTLYVKSLRLEGQQRMTHSKNDDHDPFRTDTDISSSGMVRKNNDLVHAGNAWTNGGGNNKNASVLGSLEDFALEDTIRGGGGEGGGGSTSRGGLFRSSANSSGGNIKSLGTGGASGWDQFSANEKQFGIKATYDENLYTTSLDKTSIDNKKQVEAERLAREIEGTVTTNIHIAEERGQKIQGDFDEEDLYSGVMVQERNSGAGGDNGAVIKERKQLILKPRTVGVTPTTTSAVAAKEDEKETKAKSDPTPTSSTTATSTTTTSGMKKMNYAAAAASSKTDTTKKIAPSKPAEVKIPSEAPSNTEKGTEKVADDQEEASPTTDGEEPKDEQTKTESTAAEKEAESKEETAKKQEKPKSKLNPKASSFVFNPTAAEWKPSFSGASAPPPAPSVAQPAQPSEPQHAMANLHMQPQYVHYQQMHPSMMPYQPYAAMPPRVGPQYGLMPMHGAHVNAAGPEAANAPAPIDGTPLDGSNGANNLEVEGAAEAVDNAEGREDGKNNEEAQQQQQQQGQGVGPHSQIPQQPVAMGYVPNGPPSGYYQNGMQMARGPQYPPQMVNGPRQIPVSIIL